jgi:hypothetical protein
MGGVKAWRGRVEATNDNLPYATAIAVVFLGTIVDAVSTIVGHSVVNGVEEWNGVIVGIAGLLPFPIAVVLTKALALSIVALFAIGLWRNDGPWKVCLIVPGVLWMTVGVVNVVTILISM